MDAKTEKPAGMNVPTHTKTNMRAGMSSGTKLLLAAAAVMGGLYFWNQQQGGSVSDCRYAGTWFDSQTGETMTLGCLRPVGAHYEGSYEFHSGSGESITMSLNGGYKIENGQFSMRGKDQYDLDKAFSVEMMVNNQDAPSEIIFNHHNVFDQSQQIFRRQ